MLLIPDGTLFISMVSPGVFFPDPAGAIGSHAVRNVSETARFREGDKLVRPCPASKHEGAHRLSALRVINFILLFARFQGARDEIRLVEVVHGM